MATVYLARDLKHNRSVAVKVLRPELVASIAVNRFLQEIRIAARLNHPHIVPLLDSGNVNDVLHFVMPFVEGRSLRGMLTGKESIGLVSAVAIVNEVAGALTYAHRQGIVHRDIKPENILLSEGHAVVTDFGIAKAISTAGDANLTRTGFPIGTLGYMSPEQAAGRTDLDETTDVYSLASVFYEIMVGEAPGMWVTDEAEKFQRFVDALPPHRDRLDTLPGSVEQVLVRAMSMRPEQRFPTPNEFARALHQATRQEKRYSERAVREVIKRAAEDQVTFPTEDQAMSLGTVQRIGAEVGLSAERIQNAAGALETAPPAPTELVGTAPTRQGGFLGAPAKIHLETVVQSEVPQQEFETLLEEIRTVTGEVGRVNETLGKSLSWNSLSFQNTFEGSGRLIHVMIKPKEGSTRIRVTESAGTHPAVAVAAIVLGGGVLGAAAAEIGGALLAGTGVPEWFALFVIGGVWGGTYFATRSLFKRFIKRRVRVLSGLMETIRHHITHADRSSDSGGDHDP